MRRKAVPRPRRFGPATLNLRETLDPDQLKNFAACCLVWNRIENAINVSVCFSLAIPPTLRLDVVSRINGLDGKVAIVRAALQKRFKFPEKAYKIFDSALGGALEYKRYRDGIIHAVVTHSDAPIAPTAQRQGRMDEVLITKDALDVLYQHLIALDAEMRDAVTTIHAVDRLARLNKPGAQKQIEATIQDGTAQVQSHQRARKSLPPLPEFPEEPEGSPAMEASSENPN
jgi:hypothetical protein